MCNVGDIDRHAGSLCSIAKSIYIYIYIWMWMWMWILLHRRTHSYQHLWTTNLGRRCNNSISRNYLIDLAINMCIDFYTALDYLCSVIYSGAICSNIATEICHWTNSRGNSMMCLRGGHIWSPVVDGTQRRSRTILF